MMSGGRNTFEEGGLQGEVGELMRRREEGNERGVAGPYD